jgi:hypothetical protein
VNAALDYLWSLGCERKRLALKFFGEEEPQANNMSEQGRSKNRRVEITFFRKAEDVQQPTAPVTKPLPQKQNIPAQSATTQNPVPTQPTRNQGVAPLPSSKQSATTATPSLKSTAPMKPSGSKPSNN